MNGWHFAAQIFAYSMIKVSSISPSLHSTIQRARAHTKPPSNAPLRPPALNFLVHNRCARRIVTRAVNRTGCGDRRFHHRLLRHVAEELRTQKRKGLRAQTHGRKSSPESRQEIPPRFQQSAWTASHGPHGNLSKNMATAAGGTMKIK